MATKRNVKVNLADFEEAIINNAVTQERKNADVQERNNADAQECKDAITQMRDSVETQVGGNAEAHVRSNVAIQERSNAETQQDRRKKKMVPRTNGCTYYIEDSHKKAVKMIKAYNDIDKQDVVRTALDYFLKRFMKEDGLGLTQDGVAEVEKYIWEDLDN